MITPALDFPIAIRTLTIPNYTLPRIGFPLSKFLFRDFSVSYFLTHSLWTILPLKISWRQGSLGNILLCFQVTVIHLSHRKPFKRKSVDCYIGAVALFLNRNIKLGPASIVTKHIDYLKKIYPLIFWELS